MRYYAIKHTPSGIYLPAVGKKRGGHTHQEPTKDEPPRLFTKLKSAKLAIRAYVDGKWSDIYTTGLDGTEYDGPEPRACGRLFNDYEVVEIYMREVKPRFRVVRSTPEEIEEYERAIPTTED